MRKPVTQRQLFLSLLSSLLLLQGCSAPPIVQVMPYAPSEPLARAPGTVVTIDDRAFLEGIAESAELLMEGAIPPVPHSVLAEQLTKTSCALELPSPGLVSLSVSEIYERALKTTVVVGLLYHCSNPGCKRYHLSVASGVIIQGDGVVLTNHHVVQFEEGEGLAMFVATQEGATYLVDEVLAASERDDFALLKLRGANGLPAAPLYRDEPVGNPVTVVSHPTREFYTLTQGVISRYAMKSGSRAMNITADYAKGSSGGPVFNNRGDVVGIVLSTNSINYTTIPLSFSDDGKTLALKQQDTQVAKFKGEWLEFQMNHQMTTKTCVPAATILDAIDHSH